MAAYQPADWADLYPTSQEPLRFSPGCCSPPFPLARNGSCEHPNIADAHAKRSSN